MKTAGIIGGLGPETTSKFYLELISLCQKLNPAQRPPLLIYNVPLTYELEVDEILNGICADGAKYLLIEAAEKLESAGADFVVMPCNSLHVFAKEIQNSINIPFLNLIEATTTFLNAQNIKQVGILSSLITRNNKLYELPLYREGISYTYVSDSEQERLNKIILRLIFGGYTDKDKNEFMKMILGLGVNDVVLACTDLQLLTPEIPHIKIYDTMKILANATMDEMLKS